MVCRDCSHHECKRMEGRKIRQSYKGAVQLHVKEGRIAADFWIPPRQDLLYRDLGGGDLQLFGPVLESAECALVTRKWVLEQDRRFK